MDAFTETRVLIVAPNPRFVRLFLAEQVRTLVDKGFEVYLICAPETPAGDSLSDLACPVRFIDIAREINLARDSAALLQLLNVIYKLRPSILHVHGPKPSLLALVAASLASVPVRLHTIHGLRSDGLQGTRRAIVRTMERITCTLATRCFAVSRSLADHVVAEGLASKDKVAVLHHGSWAGVSLDRFNPLLHRHKGASFRMESGIDIHSTLVTYIGRLAKDKGIDTLVQAWQRIKATHPDARLLVAGPLDPADPVAPATLESLRLDPSVVLREGFVEDVPALLAASNIFVQPSVREGLGVAALEAAAMEVPVIASRVVGLVDTVRDRRSGLLFATRDVADLTKSIDYLLAHPELQRSFGQCGRMLVQERFSQGDVLRASTAMYCKLAQSPQQAHTWSTFGKRAFDLLVSLTVLVLVSPLMLLTAVAVWVFLSRPILFTQERAGLHGKPIRIYKFRTMKQPAPGQEMIGTDELRAHWLGSLLRKLSLDELPQLFNVIRGDMSLVGPRPLLLSYLPRYTVWQRQRHNVLPGITGLAQVNGRNAVSWEQRFEFDIWYVKHHDAWVDLLILCLTIRRVIWPEGVTPNGRTSMPEFLGASDYSPT